MSIPVVLLAGGLGTRLREETEAKPKPMVEIGGYPILWHIMKTYTHYGFDEFVICLGYKGHVIKEFFLNYKTRHGSLSVDLGDGSVKMHDHDGGEKWKIHLLETGHDTMTGGRIKRAAEFLGPRRFMATYGDGVSDIDLLSLLSFHEAHGRKATLTAVRPPARFGGLSLDGDKITSFNEKPLLGEGWINGGYMVLEPGIVNYIHDDSTVFERSPLESLVSEEQLMAYRHDRFWQCMDTVRDLSFLKEQWDGNTAAWKVW